MKQFKKYIITFLLLLTCSLVFAGCSNGTDGDDNDSKEQKVSGGSINIAMDRYETLNPLLNKDKDVDHVLQLIYSSLVEIDENLKTQNILAEEVKVDSTCTSIDVTLKDAKFHDGTKVTADDVVYSLSTLKNAEDDVIYKNVLGNIANFKALDEKTVRIYLRQVYSNPTYCLAFPVVSKAFFTNKDNDLVNGENGTGMFKISNVSLNQEITLENFKDYFGDKPYIDGITVMLMPNEKTALTAFKQKQIDVMFTEDMIAGQYSGNNTVKLVPYSTLYYDFLGFNFNNSNLANADIRKIIAHAINKKDIIEKAYYGYGLIADTMIHPNSFLYSKSASTYEYDLGMAKSLLNKSGVSNLSFRILVNKENEERVEIAKMIKDSLQAVGFTITIDEVPYETYVQKIEAKDFDMLLGGWHLLTNQDISFAYSSSKVYQGQNYISYSNPEMDAKLLNAYGQVDEEKVLGAFEELQEYLGEELPYISIAFRENVGYLNKNKVGGTLSSVEHNHYRGIENIYVKSK
ncbi:MAG: peptide ABC transporter substrate-binding protein [Clostridia bacterium]|nr:peptide ABC transporter substrate-binding protein [Clostridia bacterium]